MLEQAFQEKDCTVKAYFQPEVFSTSFKLTIERDIYYSLKLVVNEIPFSLSGLYEKRKIDFKWLAEYDPENFSCEDSKACNGFSESLLISISDLSLITNIKETSQVNVAISPKSKEFYHGMKIQNPVDSDPSCDEYAGSIGKKYGLKLWKENYGVSDYQKDYAINIKSIISTKKENL